MLAASKQVGTRNRILGALPHEEFAGLLPQLEPVVLKKGDIVYIEGDNIQEAYFPEDGLLSFVSTTETGSTLEVAMCGTEGIVGLPIVLRTHTIPYQVTVQFTTRAFKIRAKKLQAEFDKGLALNKFILCYLNVWITQISQSSICNRFHSLDESLKRWLLTVQDRVTSDSLDLTHENISNALGVPRTAVTKAAGEMQRKGLIRYSRGRIFILDRATLEEESCECYRIIRDSLANS